MTASLLQAEMLVYTPESVYPIFAAPGLLHQLGALTAEMAGEGLGRNVVVATDSTVAQLYGEAAMQSLRAAGFEPHLAAMPPGESHKRWASVSTFIEAFIGAGLDRSGWVLALGGGVVGDTAGLAASIYMRGVPLVQAPTTLLAMADSSVGGKVGVDHPAGKNLLGAFKQPRAIIIDPEALGTLPTLQVACGMAEIIKAAVIGDADLFTLFEQAAPGSTDYKACVLRAIRVKKDIVEADPYETGNRALLNLGHTFGHALESCTSYARPHGVAVAQGMALAFRLAVELGICDPSDDARLHPVLAKYGLPSQWGGEDLPSEGAATQVYSAMLLDKKRRDGRLRLVLPEAIGRVRLVEGVQPEVVLRTLEELK